MRQQRRERTESAAELVLRDAGAGRSRFLQIALAKKMVGIRAVDDVDFMPRLTSSVHNLST